MPSGTSRYSIICLEMHLNSHKKVQLKLISNFYTKQNSSLQRCRTQVSVYKRVIWANSLLISTVLQNQRIWTEEAWVLDSRYLKWSLSSSEERYQWHRNLMWVQSSHLRSRLISSKKLLPLNFLKFCLKCQFMNRKWVRNWVKDKKHQYWNSLQRNPIMLLEALLSIRIQKTKIIFHKNLNSRCLDSFVHNPACPKATLRSSSEI